MGGPARDRGGLGRHRPRHVPPRPGVVVRLPRTRGSADEVDREHRWLPRIAPSLPAAVPAPLGRGVPAGGFPWPWSVYGRLSGENPVSGRLGRTHGVRREPGGVRRRAAPGSTPRVRYGCRRRFVGEPGFSSRSPPSGPVSYRAEPLSARDAGARAAIGALDGPDGTVDAGAAVAAWEASLRVPGWNGPRVWAHADLRPGNLLPLGGRLGAVIDFGRRARVSPRST
ncbi:phosphotransferase [Streptomyces sp. PmtA]|uniref:phosphotransferase n=1 Tax=Streptomyces sp. PmtA TaxID=3074275 RepID=UPI003014E69D